MEIFDINITAQQKVFFAEIFDDIWNTYPIRFHKDDRSLKSLLNSGIFELEVLSETKFSKFIRFVNSVCTRTLFS